MRPLSEHEYIVDEDSGCWIWQRSLAKGGYGKKCVKGKFFQAHRWFYEQAHGAIPKGLQLDHLCRNRLCVNPEHLEPVTNAENTRRSDKTHLNEEKVVEIKRLLAFTGIDEVAKMFSVSNGCIYHIARGDRWGDVDVPA